MRVTFATPFRNGVADINRAAEALVERQREVSSGRRVHAASDDPTAAPAILAERAELRALDQYVRATDSVESRLSVVDSTLTHVIETLTAAQTTVAAASNSGLTPQQRQAFSLELRSLRDTVLADLNTQYQGQYIFSGARTATSPYAEVAGVVQAYAGDTTEVAVDIDRGRAAVVTFDGDSLVRGGDAEGLFEVFDALAQAAASGDLAGLGQGMAALERAFDRFTAAQSRVGAGLSGLEDHRQRLDDLARASDARRSSLEDANLAESIIGMQQADAAHQAAVGAVSQATRLSLFDFLR